MRSEKPRRSNCENHNSLTKHFIFVAHLHSWHDLFWWLIALLTSVMFRPILCLLCISFISHTFSVHPICFAASKIVYGQTTRTARTKYAQCAPNINHFFFAVVPIFLLCLPSRLMTLSGFTWMAHVLHELKKKKNNYKKIERSISQQQSAAERSWGANARRSAWLSVINCGVL